MDGKERGVIRIGVAGWDYPDWNGIVYPAAGARERDRLRYLARFVDVVEVNSTFYRPVAPAHAEAWLRRTADASGFAFTAKAHRSWTHDRGAVVEEVVGPTLEGLRPLREAGNLRALLVQFPQSFHRDGEAFDRLERIADAAAGWPLVVEVRHRSWDDEPAIEWLRERGIGWCVVDQPRVGRSVLGPLPYVTSDVAYLRLHGRNVGDWFREGAGRDARYDYRYAMTELEPLAGSVVRMADEAAEVIVVQNNHFRGQAMANALQLGHLVGRDRPAAPASLVDAYPDLAELCDPERDTLF
jgi:uncharacterized protein YecE (DUF72 family)